MNPDKNWLLRYEQMKDKMKPLSDLNEYFTENEIAGKKMHLLEMGNVNFPTGNILVRDPLAYLDRKEKPYFTPAPTGVFSISVAVVEAGENHYRYAAVQVLFSDEKAEKYVEALVGDEDLDEYAEGSYFGFAVDAGLGTVVDVKTRDAYCDFCEKWYEKNPDGNIYDDFFAAEFKKSFEEKPLYQRSGGDWINFRIPDTDLSVPMFQSGWGDGAYPVYFGYDKDGKICRLVIEFIDIKLAFAGEEK